MRRHRQAGQSIAELALMLPLLLLILLGCLDLGRAFSVWMTVTNASREGARYASLHPDKGQSIRDRTKADIAAEGLSVNSGILSIDISTPLGQTMGKPVIVTVRYSLSLVTFFLFGGQPLTIQSRTEMLILGGG